MSHECFVPYECLISHEFVIVCKCSTSHEFVIPYECFISHDFDITYEWDIPHGSWLRSKPIFNEFPGGVPPLASACTCLYECPCVYDFISPFPFYAFVRMRLHFLLPFYAFVRMRLHLPLPFYAFVRLTHMHMRLNITCCLTCLKPLRTTSELLDVFVIRILDSLFGLPVALLYLSFSFKLVFRLCHNYVIFRYSFAFSFGLVRVAGRSIDGNPVCKSGLSC